MTKYPDPIRDIAERLVAFWRFLAPTQRRLLGVSWTCCGLGFAFPLAESDWLMVVLGLAFLGCLAYCLRVSGQVREELNEATRARVEAELARESGESI